MGESHSLFRIAIFLGFVMLMSSVLATPWVYVGQPLPPNSPWGQFSSGVQNFPVFNNPGNTISTIAQTPTAAESPNAIESTTGCTLALYFQCIGANDQTKWITLNASDNGLGTQLGGYFNVAMTNVSGNAVMGSVLTVWCRSVNVTDANLAPGLDNARPGPTVVRNNAVSPTCNPGNDFRPIIIPVILATGGFPVVTSTWNNLTFDVGAGVTLKLGSASQKIEVNYIQLATQVDLGGGIACGSTWDIGCQFSRAIDPIVKFFQFIGNGIIFAFQVVAWFFGMIGIFFSALLSVLTLPGAPPLVSGLVGIIIIGCIFFVTIVLMGKIRGTANVG